MSEFSFCWTSGGSGDSGPYSASFFADIYSSLFYQEPTARANASVIFGTGDGTNDPLAVTETSPASNAVSVKIGKALVQGYFYFNDAAKSLTVTPNTDGSGFDRIDTVVLGIDFVNQTVRLSIVAGTPAASPVAPTLTKTTSLWQVPIANIAVANLFSTIVNANIDNTVKVNGIAWQVNHGGTGFSSVAEGDLLVGNSSLGLSKLSTPASYQMLVGDTAQNINMKWVGDLRPHKIRGNGTSISGVNPNLVPFASADWVNPASLITALSSNQFSLAAGTYIVEGFIDFTTDTAMTFGWWIADSTAPNTALAISDWATHSTAVGNINRQIMSPQLLVSTGSELFEVYFERSAAGTVTLATGSTTGMTPTNLTPYGREIWFRKIL